jgi:tripartite-type tricarboxylate transporter receptor subunit TctC
VRVLALLSAIGWFGVAGSAASSEADGFPNRPVKIVVPYAAGATTDTLARTMALKLEGMWKQSVVVENLPGGGGLTGAGTVARTPADGYTFVIVTASHVISPAIMARPPFDPIKAFTPVTMLAKSPGLLVASKQSGFKTIPEMVAQGKKAELTYGTSGVGSKHHVAMAELARLADIKAQHVAYRGSAQAMNDIIGGHLPLQMGSISFAKDFVLNDKVYGLALVAEKRHPMLPNVPTLAELGYPLTSSEWWALLGPAGIPRAIVDKVAADVAQVLQMPDVKARMPSDELVSSTSDELLRFMQNEAEVWGGVATRAGIRIE